MDKKVYVFYMLNSGSQRFCLSLFFQKKNIYCRAITDDDFVSVTNGESGRGGEELSANKNKAKTQKPDKDADVLETSVDDEDVDVMDASFGETHKDAVEADVDTVEADADVVEAVETAEDVVEADVDSVEADGDVVETDEDVVEADGNVVEGNADISEMGLGDDVESATHIRLPTLPPYHELDLISERKHRWNFLSNWDK